MLKNTFTKDATFKAVSVYTINGKEVTAKVAEKSDVAVKVVSALDTLVTDSYAIHIGDNMYRVVGGNNMGVNDAETLHTYFNNIATRNNAGLLKSNATDVYLSIKRTGKTRFVLSGYGALDLLTNYEYRMEHTLPNDTKFYTYHLAPIEVRGTRFAKVDTECNSLELFDSKRIINPAWFEAIAPTYTTTRCVAKDPFGYIKRWVKTEVKVKGKTITETKLIPTKVPANRKKTKSQIDFLNGIDFDTYTTTYAEHRFILETINSLCQSRVSGTTHYQTPMFGDDLTAKERFSLMIEKASYLRSKVSYIPTDKGYTKQLNHYAGAEEEVFATIDIDGVMTDVVYIKRTGKDALAKPVKSNAQLTVDALHSVDTDKELLIKYNLITFELAKLNSELRESTETRDYLVYEFNGYSNDALNANIETLTSQVAELTLKQKAAQTNLKHRLTTIAADVTKEETVVEKVTKRRAKNAEVKATARATNKLYNSYYQRFMMRKQRAADEVAKAIEEKNLEALKHLKASIDKEVLETYTAKQYEDALATFDTTRI